MSIPTKGQIKAAAALYADVPLPAFHKPQPRPKKPRKPLQRKRMKRGPSRRSLNRKLAEALYVRWVHAQPCCIDPGDHEGPIQQSHGRNLNGPTGLGLKESDFASVPMCRGHHEQWEQHRGIFARLNSEQRRAYMVAQIAAAHLAFQLEGGVIP